MRSVHISETAGDVLAPMLSQKKPSVAVRDDCGLNNPVTGSPAGRRDACASSAAGRQNGIREAVSHPVSNGANIVLHCLRIQRAD